MFGLISAVAVLMLVVVVNIVYNKMSQMVSRAVK